MTDPATVSSPATAPAGPERVLVAMSGGVDSAVAAALLVEQGHDVTGVHLKLADMPLDAQIPGQGCCTLDDAQDARRVAQVLGIPFYVWDLSELFERSVREPFARTYATGCTPNPCIECNRAVKYAALLERATALGFDALATGHHARVEHTGASPRMLRGADPAKDQTYVLYVATQDQLRRTRLPIGHLTKDAVRAHAGRLGLRVADKPESYDVCFIPDGDTASYLGRRLPTVPGAIVDTDGHEIGQHGGIWRYTVGQRRGLGLDAHERRYVVEVDAARNELRVGPREALACRWVEVTDVNWIAGREPTGPLRAQIRAHGETVACLLEGDRVSFAQPVEGVARGQACVLYTEDGQECLGGGTIAAADRSAAVTVGEATSGPTRTRPGQAEAAGVGW